MKKLFAIVPALLFFAFAANAQSYMADMQRQSARSDKIVGRVEKGKLAAGGGDVKITINVPSFEMTLWQSGKEIGYYRIGIGMVEYPLPISLRKATSIDWNPVWIPPSSDWIEKSSTVKAGEVVLPTDPRNPLGKVKIPLGYGYLIHQARSDADIGGLVSHGCVRVRQPDIYDLSEKIVAALALDASPEQIGAAKRTKKTFSVLLEPPVPVEITYDPIIVENGMLHIYADVYSYKTNTVENVRAELKSSGVNDEKISDAAIERILKGVSGKRQFVIAVDDIANGAVARGRYVPAVSPTGGKRAR